MICAAMPIYGSPVQNAKVVLLLEATTQQTAAHLVAVVQLYGRDYYRCITGRKSLRSFRERLKERWHPKITGA